MSTSAVTSQSAVGSVAADSVTRDSKIGTIVVLVVGLALLIAAVVLLSLKLAATSEDPTTPTTSTPNSTVSSREGPLNSWYDLDTSEMVDDGSGGIVSVWAAGGPRVEVSEVDGAWESDEQREARLESGELELDDEWGEL